MLDASLSFDTTASSEQASSLVGKSGSVVVVVTIALGLLSLGAVAS